MRLQFWVAVALLSATIAPTAVSAALVETSSPSQTKEDRLALAMERLNKPIASIYAGDLADGQTQFEALLDETRRTHGKASVEAADLLHVFGLSLGMAAIMSGDERLKAMELSYDEAAIAAYRAALGPVRPEVADAIQSYAAAIRRANSDNPSPP